MTTLKAKIENVEYHKPEYHVTIKIYVDNILNSDITIIVPDHVDINDAKEMVKNKLREIKNTLSLGSQLNTYTGQEIVL